MFLEVTTSKCELTYTYGGKIWYKNASNHLFTPESYLVDHPFPQFPVLLTFGQGELDGNPPMRPSKLFLGLPWNPGRERLPCVALQEVTTPPAVNEQEAMLRAGAAQVCHLLT